MPSFFQKKKKRKITFLHIIHIKFTLNIKSFRSFNSNFKARLSFEKVHEILTQQKVGDEIMKLRKNGRSLCNNI